jgi:hypothetical protein
MFLIGYMVKIQEEMGEFCYAVHNQLLNCCVYFTTVAFLWVEKQTMLNLQPQEISILEVKELSGQ